MQMLSRTPPNRLTGAALSGMDPRAQLLAWDRYDSLVARWRRSSGYETARGAIQAVQGGPGAKRR